MPSNSATHADATSTPSNSATHAGQRYINCYFTAHWSSSCEETSRCECSFSAVTESPHVIPALLHCEKISPRKVIFFALCHTFSNFHLIFSEARLCLFLAKDCLVPSHWFLQLEYIVKTSDREALKYSCDLFCSCYLILIHTLFVIYFSFIF